MAFNIAVTSKYNPFTYEDYIKPLEQYTKDYKEQEEKIQEKLTNIAALEPLIHDSGIADHDENTEYINHYKNYVQSLNDLTNKLYTEGFDRRSQSQGFLDTQKAYSSKILPLSDALAAMKKAHAEEDKLRQQGFILGKGSNNWSISDFYGMNTPGEAAKVSLDSIETNTAEIARSLTGAMETKYSIDKKKIIEGALDGYTAEKGINALKYASNYDQLSPAELNVIGLIESQVRERILNDLGYTEEEYNALDSNTKQKINERVHAGLIKGLSYGENITPRRHVSSGERGGSTNSNVPYWHITANGVTPGEKAFTYARGLSNAIDSQVNQLTAQGHIVTKVLYGGVAMAGTPMPANPTQADSDNYLPYDVRNISFATGSKSSIPIQIEYTPKDNPNKKEVITVGQVKGNVLTSTTQPKDDDDDGGSPDVIIP